MNYITDPLIIPYKIGLDDNQFQLIKECVSETGSNIGNRYDITVGYYSSFQSVLTRLVTLLSNDINYSSISEYLNAYREQHFTLMSGFAEFLSQDK